MALAAIASPQAYAAGELTEVNYTPDPSVAQLSISKIQLQFMQANYGISGHVDVSDITLTHKGGTEVLYALPDPVTDYARLYLEFAYKGDTSPVTITEDGIYTLHIPAGAVKTISEDSSNAEINVNFTVSSDVVTPMTAYTLSPEAGLVDEISSIAITFPESGGLDWFHNDLFGKGNLSGITLTHATRPDLTYTAVMENFDRNKTVTFAFADATGDKCVITEPGTYMLDIPSGTFMNDNYSASVANSRITAEYTIKGPAPVEFEGFIANPAEGSATGQLTTFAITFPAMPGGLDYPVSNAESITLLAPDGAIYNGLNARVQSSDSGSYNTLLLDFCKPDTEAIVNNAITFTAPGEYVVTIPEGVLGVYGSDAVNEEIRVSFNVDPLLNFTYTLDPSPAEAHASFEPFSVGIGSSLASLGVKAGSGLSATISLGSEAYTLNATADADATAVSFSLDEKLSAPGEWQVTIPAGFLEGTDHEGRLIPNHEPIAFTYIIKEPEQFPYTAEPADGATVEFFKNITLLFSGDNLHSISIDPAAGVPVLKADDSEKTYELQGAVSAKYVIFTVQGGVSLPDGAYSVTIPDGYIRTTGADKLTAAVPEIKTSFIVENITADDYTKGILFLNEGWFGHDTGSLNFYSNSGEWIYNAFLRNNPEHRLGITSQYGQCFGNRLFVVSKQTGSESGITGGHLTVLDATTLKFIGQITEVPDIEAQPRAFCAWDAHKGYLSTSKEIYAVDLDKFEVISVVPGTDIYTSSNSNGEMLRYGDRVFAIRAGESVDVIDPATEDVEAIPVYVAEAFAVTPDGSLYVATRDESNEFVKISTTAPYEILERFDIDESKAKIANIWTTWRKAPIAASTTGNTVYYVTQAESEAHPAGARTVARYDFDTKTFTPDFITLPGVADGLDADWMLYGEGVSVNPADGRILLTAVEAGYGTHYQHNRVFVADPETGRIIDDETLCPDDNYWFPAMTLYPDFDAPEIDIEKLDMSQADTEFTISMPEITTLAVGNPHLISYAVSSTDGLCEVTPDADKPGVFHVSNTAGGFFSLSLKADYQGKIAVADIDYSPVSGIGAISAGTVIPEVYDLNGIVVLRDATEADIQNLAPGIYIAAGRKYIVR